MSPASDVDSADAAVAEQYERYPYPPRDPEGERRNRPATWLGNLLRINGMFWGGRRDPGALHILDAGCGTGDATIYLAHQAPRAAIVALDASTSSLAIARRRAEIRELDNIRFVHASLLDLPRLGLGPFDYIVCAGVLHHLADPDAGLAALRDVLAPRGGLGLMLYARFGREPVYQVQDLVRRIAGAEPLDARVGVAHEVLGALSPQHFFKLGRLEQEFLDIAAGPSGVVDLLLHARDRAYTVPDVHTLLEGCGLRLLEFDLPVLYRPESYPLSDDLRARVRGLDERERQAIAELLNGRLAMHKFYATRAGVPREAPGAGAAPESIRPIVYDPLLAGYLASLPAGPQPFLLESPWGFSIDLTLTAADVELLRGIDGHARLDEILARAARALRDSGIPTGRQTLLDRWNTLYAALAVCGYVGHHWATS